MAKPNLKASLVRYAPIDGIGWRRGSIVTAKNGRVKPDVMLYNGQEHSIPPDSVYQVRHYEGDKVKYTTVGADYEQAKTMLHARLASSQLKAAQQTLGIVPGGQLAPATRTMADLAGEYLDRKKSPSLNLSRTTIRHYAEVLDPEAAGSFARVREFANQVTEDDVTKYMDTLKREGYSQKTRTMRYTTVRGFLTWCGADPKKIIDSATHRRLSERPPLNTDPYSQPELENLMAASDPFHQVIFQFLLATGLRYREANHLTWSNVDFARNLIHVPWEQRINRTYTIRRTRRVVTTAVEFNSKSRRKREVPIFASLRPLLAQLRAQYPDSIYVFGSRRSDMPDNHWLAYGKRAWKRAGLNCGVCDGCAKRGECEGFYLHKFRHTFAHRCLDAGIPIHKVSRWMGHHSIEVTAIYLSGGSMAADRDPFAVRESQSFEREN